METPPLLTLWILSSWLLTALDAVVGPKFSNSPEPIVAPLGDEVEFECSLDVPAEQIRWKHNRKLLPNVFHNATKSQLIFRVEKESQVGEYECVARYGASALASTPARLSLATLGEATPPFHRKLRVTAANNVLINCSLPVSNPPPTIQYYLNNQPFLSGLVLPSGSLLLSNVSQADSGQYSCSVSNTYVRDSPLPIPSYHNLNVVSGQRDRRPPQVSFQPPAEYSVLIGSNVTLERVAFGEPVPRVMWRRAGAGAGAGDGAGAAPLNHPRYRVFSGGLIITRVEPSDGGVYICDFDNGVEPSLHFEITLRVLEPPSIVKRPEDREAKEGGRVSLECSARGKPTPSIHWLLNGNLVTNDTHVRVYGGRLELDHVEKRHAGWYQCMAQNIVSATFETSQLLVVPRQVAYNHSVHFDDLPEEPPPRRTPPQHQKKHQKKNKDAMKEMIPPSRPFVTRLTDESVMVSWHVPPNSGLPILFFKVQYRELHRDKHWKTCNEDIPPHVNSYEVINLTPDSDFRFRISAVYSNMDNKQGPTSSTFHLKTVTSPKQVPQTPKLAHLSAAGPTSIQIVWEYNASQPIVQGFYVYYRSTSSAGDYLMATVEGQAARSHVVTHLEPDTAYDFKLQSFTVNAASDFSEILTQKTEKPVTASPPVSISTPRTHVQTDDKSGNQLYVTLGAVLGGLALLLALCTWIFCCNKQWHHHSTNTDDDDVDKSRHIQMETIHVNGHVASHMGSGSHVTGSRDASGGVVVSKTTSNGCCNKMNITSNPLDADESKTLDVMEIAFITTASCENKCGSSVLTARLASAAATPVLPSCAMESESWRLTEMPRTVDNYV